MFEETIKILQGDDEEKCNEILQTFINKHSQSFTFPGLNGDLKQSLFEALLKKLNCKTQSKTHAGCLETIRIVSREKTGIDVITEAKALQRMVQLSGLEINLDVNGEAVATQNADNLVVVEAQKCLCNIIFNSREAQRICSTNGCVEGIVQRLKTYKDPALIHDIKFFDMRILFLLTALVPQISPKLLNDLHGFTYLIEVLDLALSEGEGQQSRPLDDKSVDLSCEVLKILFNITVHIDKINLDEEEEAHFMRLVSILHDLLLCETHTKDKKEELQSHTVNLLTNMPKDSYDELLTPVSEASLATPSDKDTEFDGKNMEAVVVLLEFLDHRLNDTPKSNLKEKITPILHCLCEICRANRAIRKFCRLKVLPYMKDEVKQLPDEGNSLRNKLIRLFTNPIHEVKDLSADFLFVLCKESVTRFVKYTGYGNAAGLLAQRGLMCGGRGGHYSSESEDSDTEEYSMIKDKVNPITGRLELEEREIKALELMTDEQKEYEAMKLLNQIDKLSKSGIIQPATLGPDGKPRAVANVTELMENMNIPTTNDNTSDTE